MKLQEREFLRLASEGRTAREIAAELDYTTAGIYHMADRHGVTLARPPRKPRAYVRKFPPGPRDMARAAEMAALRAEGKTLEEVGQQFGVSRERVRQIVNAYQQVQ